MNIYKWLVLLILPINISLAAEVDTKPSNNEKDLKKIDSSINLSASGGSDKYAESAMSLTLGFSPNWGSDFFTSTTRLNGTVVERGFGIAPFVKISDNQQLKIEVAIGDQSPNKSRTTSLQYDVNLAPLWGGEMKTDLTLKASSTLYKVDGVQTSPRETQLYAALNQDFSDFWSAGVSFTNAGYGDLAIKSYRRNSIKNGFTEDIGVFDSGPLDRQMTISIGLNPTDTCNLQLELMTSQPVGGGAKNNSTSLSWNQSWTEKWATGFRVTSSKVDPDTRSSGGINTTYTF